MMADLNPKVSIVIPVYNGANYLNEAIDSALAQTYDNVEVIVVNDGSNDEGQTEAIAKSYGQSIRYYYKDNGGVSSALNLGIKQMNGDYFAWLSHDDLYLKQNVDIQIKELIKYPHILVSFCNATVFNNSKEISTSKKIDTSQIVSEAINGPLFFFQRWIYACSLIVHRSCFEKVGLVDESLKTSQDVEFTLRLLSNFEVINIKCPLVLRRDHVESGFNTQRLAVRNEYDRLIEQILDDKGLSFFFKNIDNDINIAEAYNKLGDYVIYDSDKYPMIFYKKSINHWPSLFNTACYKIIFGKKITKIYFGIKSSIISRWNKYLACN